MADFYKTEKTTFYNPNGTGRDGYIYQGNGGHAAPSQENKQPGHGTQSEPETHYHYRSPYVHSKPVQYTSDGSGRDSYIQTCAGGLNAQYAPGQMVDGFLTSLRSGGPSAAIRSKSNHGYRPRKVPLSKKADPYLTAQDTAF